MRAKGVSSIEGKRMESPPTFIEGTRRKNQKDDGLRILKMKVQELFTHGEGISTPTCPSQGTKAFNQLCKYDFKTMYFPFSMFLYFSLLCAFYVFLLLCAFYVFYFCVVDKGVSLTPTYSSITMKKSDLHSSLRTKRWLSCFYL